MKLFKKLTALLVVMFAFVTVLAVANVVEAADVTITFDNTAKRTAFTTSQQIWVENGITITNNKGKSTSSVADYVEPARFYKSSELIVAYTGKFTSVTFDCNSTAYATAMKNSITVGTATVSSDKVTVTFAEAVSSYTVASLTGGQVRMDAISVTPYVEGEAPTPTIGISGTAYAMVGDDTVTLESSVTNLEDYTVTWDSSNENVATVSNGVVTVLGEGKTTITAVIDGTEVSTTTDFIVYPDNSEEISIAKAIEICNLVGNSQTPYLYSATGVVTSITTTNWGIDVIISEGENEILLYGLENVENVVMGSRITVTGKLKNYSNNTPEFDSGCTYVEAAYDKNTAIKSWGSQDTKLSLSFSYTSSSETVETEGENVYQLVTDASELADGDKIIIAASGSDYALSTEQRTSNRGSATIEKNANYVNSLNDDVQVLTVGINAAGYYTLYTGSGYLYAAGSASSGNNLKTTNDNTDLDAQWTITVDDNGNAKIQAQGDAGRDIIRFNSTNDPKLFSCYASGQADVCIYKESSVSEKTTYNVKSVNVRFGTMISVSLYEALVAAGTEVEFGVVALKAATLESAGKTLADYIETENYVCTPVRVNEFGEEDENGDYYQFALVIKNVPMSDLDVEITAACYVSIDGEITLMNEATESVRSVANIYLDNGVDAEFKGVLQYIAEYTQE